MVIPLQMGVSSPILPYYGSQQRSFFSTFLLFKQEWMLHGKQAFSQKKPPLLFVPEPQKLTSSGMRDAEKALLCVMLCTVLWPMVSCASPSGRSSLHHLHQGGGGWQCQEKIGLLQHKAFSTIKPSGFARQWYFLWRCDPSPHHGHSWFLSAWASQGWREKEGGWVCPISSRAGCHPAPLCSSFWVPAGPQSLTARQAEIPHCTNLAQTMQASPRSSRHPCSSRHTCWGDKAASARGTNNCWCSASNWWVSAELPQLDSSRGDVNSFLKLRKGKANSN